MKDIQTPFCTLPDAIQHYAKTKPSHKVLRFFADGENNPDTLTYFELDQQCRAIAHELKAYEGKTAVLLYQPGLDFLLGFFSCLYAGVIAVPAYPPRKNHNLDRLLSVLNDCQPTIILSTTQQIALSRPLCSEHMTDTHKHLSWLATDDISPQLAASFVMPDIHESLAFLQYTSGSTGEPKGVMVSHKNIVANINMAQSAYQIPQDTHCVSWLPLFHDMGLIGAVMMPVYWGAGAILMPPNAFLQNPLRFLKLIDCYGKQFPIGATQPNFAYQLLVDQVADEDIEGLDLSPWCFAMTGAEPIRAETLDAFTEKYRPLGFDAKVLRPAYGMAECTLLSTCNDKDTLIEAYFDKNALTNNQLTFSTIYAQRFISAGRNIPPQTLRIVDPTTFETLEDGQIGEIWLNGPHIARGYWQKTSQTQEIFEAFTTDDEGPFLRTGDLAGMIEGELFIAGRLKDLVIIRGKNHHPQDIELTAAKACPSLVKDSIAAITVSVDHHEHLVIVAEIQRSARRDFPIDKAGREIQKAIAKIHGIETKAIEFIRFASLPKTSSGKIQRFLVKQQYLANTLKSAKRWENPRPTKQLQFHSTHPFESLSIKELRIELVSFFATNIAHDCTATTPLNSLGLDSIQWLTLASEIESWCGKTLDVSIIWQLDNIDDLALYLLTLKSPSNTNESAEIEGFL